LLLLRGYPTSAKLVVGRPATSLDLLPAELRAGGRRSASAPP